MKIVVVSDMHVNSTLGLWPPAFVADRATPKPQNKFQEWLWACWLDFCEFAAQQGERVLVLNGDLVQGIKPSKDIEVMVFSPTDQKRAAVEVLKPLQQGVKATYVVKGTEWHEGPSGHEVEELAEAIGGMLNEEVAQHTHWLLNMRLGGKLFSFSHHTSVTTVYHSTPPTREWREAKEMYADFGQPVPDCIVRSHVHRFGIVPDGTGDRLYFTCPGWQLKNAHAFKVKPLTLPSIGGLVLWVENGHIMYQKKLYSIPPSPVIELGLSPILPCNNSLLKSNGKARPRRKQAG